MILSDDFPNWADPKMQERLKRRGNGLGAKETVICECIMEAIDTADTVADLRKAVKALAKYMIGD